MPEGLPFKHVKPLIGMIHLSGSNGEVVRRALKELEIYENEGLDGAIIENYHCQDLGKLCMVMHESRKMRIARGVNILPLEFHRAFSIAKEYGASFIQLDIVAGRYDEAPQGIDVREFTMERRYHPEIAVLGGVHFKYYTPRTDLYQDLIEGKSFAEVVVVTGSGTAEETPLEKIKEFRRHLGSHSLYVGAGLTPENALAQLRIADGAIVGSYLKKDGKTSNPVDAGRVKELVRVVKTLRPR